MTRTIADLNDQLRRNIWIPGPKNKVVITSNLAADPKLAADAIAAVRSMIPSTRTMILTKNTTTLR